VAYVVGRAAELQGKNRPAAGGQIKEKHLGKKKTRKNNAKVALCALGTHGGCAQKKKGCNTRNFPERYKRGQKTFK